MNPYAVPMDNSTLFAIRIRAIRQRIKSRNDGEATKWMARDMFRSAGRLLDQRDIETLQEDRPSPPETD